ncbi:alpha/beta fold hydrolase [Roseovarius aestuarii]|uniref:4,5:9,10-diseco-3-hydroxy-5,9, 17-trioxoandrosta-1(10),2-diene-4-oate hydrolase n=1 Tax=Roseovarius aestuarii TaxID=475083 RepID=A0A1X7BTW0_9RHOB|nr:alpha/beta hydrolase [Roseovarius aestuarii]SMC12659.1 4,5:9,10-diseco-3-hydroxy-5,9, 17-trioxoandrosta-1(10),2-diene-4-oate hydrolase [Roseovarius aestuarii]
MSDAASTVELSKPAYLRQGRGYPLVLVHGYLGGAAMWRRQLEALSADFDVIAPELPGYGDSHAALAEASIEDYARQVLALLDDLGVYRFHLLGHSMGGMIVQQMAAVAPDRVTLLICYGTGPLGALPNRFETIDQSRERLSQEGVKPTARRIAATWFTAGETARDYDACVALGESVSTASAMAGLTAMENWDGRAALAGIAQPTLIVWGDKDRSYGWQQPEALWKGIANSNLAVMPGCGHNAHMENPELFNTIVHDFLTEETDNALS